MSNLFCISSANDDYKLLDLNFNLGGRVYWQFD